MYYGTKYTPIQGTSVDEREFFQIVDNYYYSDGYKYDSLVDRRPKLRITSHQLRGEITLVQAGAIFQAEKKELIRQDVCLWRYVDSKLKHSQRRFIVSYLSTSRVTLLGRVQAYCVHRSVKSEKLRSIMSPGICHLVPSISTLQPLHLLLSLPARFPT